MEESAVQKLGGKIFTFGSYRLNVGGPDSDIDSLVVAPRMIDRMKHFFGMLAPILKNNPDVTDLKEVPEASVPVIKLKYQGVDIDMLFARVECTTIGPDFENLQDNNILRNVDEETIKSLNGCRVTDMILNFIPNKPNFELTLRVIKLWAKHRGVYSNLLGYLGGVNWAIMVARICMDNPEAAPNQLI